MEFEIRQCKSGDAPALALLGAATFFESHAGLADAQDMLSFSEQEHSVQFYERLIADASARIWAVETCNTPIGYAVTLRSPGSEEAPTVEILRVYLLHRFHRCGLGAKLLMTAIQSARDDGAAEVHLKVHEQNTKAQSLYRRFGFRAVGIGAFPVGTRDHMVLLMKLSLVQRTRSWSDTPWFWPYWLMDRIDWRLLNVLV